MTDTEILVTLKHDLQIATTSLDTYLGEIISLAKRAISTEGITLANDIPDGMLVEQYAAFLYRKRREETYSMPRYLRWMLNNRLFSEKAKVSDGD